MVQWVGEETTRDNLLGVLQDVHTIYTYNGSRFDLPFIRTSLGVDLYDKYQHHDLMYDCWRNNLYGGFKAVRSAIPDGAIEAERESARRYYQKNQVKGSRQRREKAGSLSL